MGIWARGASARELFEALGLGLFAIITDLRSVRPNEERVIHASATDATALVVAWLGELLLLQQTEGFLVREVQVKLVGSPPTALLAKVRGEPFEPERHARGTEVKAITFHALTIDLERGRARVIVDI
jgi:SHS2 domain-containing protein